ncbi:MAG TPA: Chromate resistance protein ChrB [Anaerolineales bacterium]
MEWLLFTSQLPVSPSSLRVTVWRRMKAAGALSLQNGVWVLPRTKEQERALQELLDYLAQQGAEGQSFAATPLSEKVEKGLIRRFKGQRDEEYAELIERCEGLLAELARETKKRKFTFAELEENEADLQKLEGWMGRIKARDLVGGDKASAAASSLEACRKALQMFANRVYAQEQVASKQDSSG